MKTKIQKIAQKYKNTCSIVYDEDTSILLWKGFFKRYRAIYTRSETHQQLKLSYGNITMKIAYVRLPEKPGINKHLELFKLPSFVSINGNQFRTIDIITYTEEKELNIIEEEVKNKLQNNKNIDFKKFNENVGSLLKTILLAYSLFTKFLAFLDKEYKELYNIIMSYSPSINKNDIKQFLFDSDELMTIEALNQALEEALMEEDYERASELKKQIEMLKNEQL